MTNELNTELRRDRLTLLGRLTGKLGHAINNSLTGASGLIELATEEPNQEERNADLREAMRALGPIGLALRRAVEIAINAPEGRQEHFAIVLGRITDMTLILSRIGTPTVECPPECGAVLIPAPQVEHALMASLTMIADRSKVNAGMTVRCHLAESLHVEVEGTGLSESPTTDQLDDLQQPLWERIMTSCAGTIEIKRNAGQIRVRFSCPAVLE